MRTVLRLAAALLAAFALLTSIGGSQALASNVHCGDTITQDTTLDSDLLGCSGFGLRVEGTDITLNLNGHVVEGAITMRSEDSEGRSLGHGNLVLENGTVVGGVGVGYTQDAALSHMTIPSAAEIVLEAASGSARTRAVPSTPP